MSDAVVIGAIVGLILALIGLFQDGGRSLYGWAIVAVCAGLLWGGIAGLLD